MNTRANFFRREGDKDKAKRKRRNLLLTGVGTAATIGLGALAVKKVGGFKRVIGVAEDAAQKSTTKTANSFVDGSKVNAEAERNYQAILKRQAEKKAAKEASAKQFQTSSKDPSSYLKPEVKAESAGKYDEIVARQAKEKANSKKDERYRRVGKYLHDNHLIEGELREKPPLLSNGQYGSTFKKTPRLKKLQEGYLAKHREVAATLHPSQRAGYLKQHKIGSKSYHEQVTAKIHIPDQTARKNLIGFCLDDDSTKVVKF